jgi:hypothetical protein
MRLQRIYSSKLYVTSTRKDKIHAAIQDPVNAELVQQISEYLDDDAQIVLKRAVAQEKAAETAADTGEEEVIAPSDTSSAPGGSGSHHSSFSGSPVSDFGEDELADIDVPDDMGEEAPAPETPVEETTKANGKSITATSLIWTTVEDVASECDTIQGTLNAREDTNGVIRMQVKDAELWIYYKDDANLNDKMIEVIEVLNSTGYTYLAFSRLARSNNAIVFDINLNTSEDIKSVKDIEEETE